MIDDHRPSKAQGSLVAWCSCNVLIQLYLANQKVENDLHETQTPTGNEITRLLFFDRMDFAPQS